MLDDLLVQKIIPLSKKQVPPLESAKQETLDWLNNLILAVDVARPNWDEALKFFPPDPEDEKVEGATGFKIRLAFRLYTKENRYLVTVIGSLDPADKGKFIICAHVNWKTQELKMKKTLEKAYSGHFDDEILDGSQVVWIQTVKTGEFHSALDSCAAGILGHELVDHPCEVEKTIVKRPPNTAGIIDPPEHSHESPDKD